MTKWHVITDFQQWVFISEIYNFWIFLAILLYTQIKFLSWLGHPLSFPCLPSNAFPDIGSVGLKKKKNHKKSRNSRPWYARKTLKVNVHIFGLKKCTIYWEKCSCFCSCFSLCCLTMLIVQIKRIISSEKWCNYVVTFFFFFLENGKNLGRLDDGKWRKKRGCNTSIYTGFISNEIYNNYSPKWRWLVLDN